jgi:hypothetical protein
MVRYDPTRRLATFALVALAAVLVVTVAATALSPTVLGAPDHPARVMQTPKEVGGRIITDTVWTAADGPYVASESVRVADGVTLTVETGVNVAFSEGASLDVDGNLRVNGTRPGDVVFTSNKADKVRGDWPGVQIGARGRATLRGLAIRYAGRSSEGALEVLTNTVTIDGLLIEETGSAGLYIDGMDVVARNVTVRHATRAGVVVKPPRRGMVTVDLTGATLTDNDDDAVTSAGNVQWVLGGSTVSGNHVNGIRLRNGSISEAVTWSGGDMPYVLDGTLDMRGSLTVQAGTVVKLTDTGNIRVAKGAAFNVSGASGQVVYFTTIADDTVCSSGTVDCDTNNDRNATVPARGSWGGLVVEAAGTLSHAEVRYSSGPAIDIKIAGIRLEHVKVTTTLRDAIRVRSVATAIVDCEVADSRNPGLADAAAIWIEASAANAIDVELRRNRFLDNDIAVIVRDPNANLITEGNSTPGFTNEVNGYQFTGGDLRHSRTWRAGDLPYVVAGRITLQETITLTLEAGLTVKMDTRAALVAERGRMRIGTPSGEKVLVTSFRDDACSATQDSGCDTNGNGGDSQPAPGDWESITVKGSSSGAFVYNTVMRYGGKTTDGGIFDLQHSNSVIRDSTFTRSGSAGLRVYQASTTLEHNLITDNIGHGLVLRAGPVSIVVTLKSNTIRNNGGNAIDSDANVELVVDASNTVEDNFRNGIVMHGDALVTHTWRRTADQPARAIPYILIDDVVVSGKSTLTIEPGTVIKLFEAASISVTNGRLVADGTADRPIIFTSLRDDSYGGNSDPKDGSTSPNAGDWKGLILKPSPGRGASITHALIMYSGESGSAAIRIETGGSEAEPVRVANVTMKHGSGQGIYAVDAAYNTAGGEVSLAITDVTVESMRGACIELRAQKNPFEPVISRNTLRDCAQAIVLDANVQPVMSGNIAEGNRLNGAQVEGTMTLKRTWFDGDLPYVINDRLVVGSGGTLGIEAGTVVKAMLNSYIDVTDDGNLQIPVAGSGTQAVFMTSYRDDRCTLAGGTCDTNGDQDLTTARPGDWDGIVVNDRATDASIRQLQIVNAGARTAAIVIEKNYVEVEDSTIAESGTDGVVVDNVDATVRGNLFAGNTGAGLTIKSSNAINLVVENNVFTGNGRSMIHRAKGNISTKNNVAIGNDADPMLYCADVLSDQTWAADVPRDVDCTFRVANSVLTLDPGLVLRFDQGLQINVEKELRAEGVTFSASEDNAAPGFWRGLNFAANSTGGYVRHSWMLYGGTDSSGAITAQSGKARIDVLFNKFLRLKGLAISASSEVKMGITGNIIRDVRGTNAAGIKSESANTNPDILFNRIAEVTTGVVVSRGSQPTIRMNNLAGTAMGVSNSDTSVCVPAMQNWWGDVSGATDNSKARVDACRLDDNPGGKGVKSSDHVNWMNPLKAAPPDAPAVFGPRCGVTTDTRPTVFGATSPGATVEIYDSLGANPGTPIATINADAQGAFTADVDLARGEHRLSLQAVQDARRSPVSGFRVITVRDDVPVDPASIRFEYGSGGSFRVQPLRDEAGCSVACSAASSGRVTLPPDTPVRVRVAIAGTPTSVEFIQAGQPARPLSYDGAGRNYVTESFDPVQGAFTLRINGASGTPCAGYVYIGGQNVVFMDTGAPGDPAIAPNGDLFNYDLEHGTEGWIPASPWSVSDEMSHSKTHAWSDSPGVDDKGQPNKYLPRQELELRAPGPIDMRTVTSPVLSFYHTYSFARGDLGLIQIRRGDGSWQPLTGADYRESSGGWRGEIIPLDEYAREPRLYLRFLLRSDASEEADGWHIDDIGIIPGGMLNRRYDAGEPLVKEAEVTLEWQNLDTGAWLTWDGTPSGQLNPQSTDELGRYGFYYLEPGIYRTVLNLRGKSMAASEPLVVWNGSIAYDVPMTMGQPIYMPVVVDKSTLRRR